MATDSNDIKEQENSFNDEKTTKNNNNVVNSPTISTGDAINKDKVEAAEVHESWGDIMEKIDNENKDQQEPTPLEPKRSGEDVEDKNENINNAANDNNNNDICGHGNNSEQLADIRLSDDVKNEDSINVILDKKFIMKLVERFSNGLNLSVNKGMLAF